MKEDPQILPEGTPGRIQINRIIMVPMLAVGMAALATGCCCCKSAKKQEAPVALAEMSAPARATVDRVTAGGQVEKITKEVEKGKSVYDVEATVGGKHMEWVVAEADGAVLGTEVPIEFGELPEPVRAAAEKFFGTAVGLKAMKGVEYGETSYEIEGQKDGKTAEVSFDPQGKRLE